jgi:hypothetical protein
MTHPIGPDNRGVTSTLTTALTIGITTILILGIVFAAGAFLDNQRQTSTESELRTIGNRLATEIASVDAVAQRGGNVTVESSQPVRIAGNTYSVVVRTGSACDRSRFHSETCLELSYDRPDVTTYVPVRNSSAVSVESASSGTFAISATGSGYTGGDDRVSPQQVDLDTTVGVANEAPIDAPIDASLGNRPPVASFEFEPTSPWDGQGVTFDASGSSDPDGSINAYRWDFTGDGTVDNVTTDPVITRTFSAGSREVTLTVEDDEGTTVESSPRFIGVSGLVYNSDLDVRSDDNDVSFTVTNTFPEDVTITHVLVDPKDDTIDEVADSPEIYIDSNVDGPATSDGDVDDSFDLYDDGRIVDLDSSAKIDSGDTGEVEINGFDTGSMEGKALTVGLKYEIGDRTNSTRFIDAVGGAAITSYGLDVTGQDVDLSFESTNELSDIDVDLGGDVGGTLDESDFSQSGSGPYTYTAGVSDGSSGLFEANLTAAETTSGQPASGTPYTDSALVSGSGDYIWTTESDWNNATNAEGVVHADYGNRSPDQLELGYAADDSGLVAYYPFEDQSVATDASASGGDNDGTVNGNPGASVGIFGSSGYDLDGTDDHVEVPYDSSLDMSSTDEVTVSAWVNKDEAQSGWIAIFQSSDESYNLHFHDGNEPVFTIYDGDHISPGRDEQSYEVETDEWIHLVGVFDGSSVKLYDYSADEDPKVIDDTADEIKAENEMDLGIGKNIDTGGRHLDGQIDELRVYDRALNETEVDNLNKPAVDGGSLTTAWKNGTEITPGDATIKYDVDQSSGDTIEVRVGWENPGGNTKYSNWVELSGDAGTVDLSSVPSVPEGYNSTEYRFEVKMDSPTVDSSPTVKTLEVVDGS